ncbi:MAG: hypothetical protein WEA29_08240 [Acidimicrobiia bacterium]
MTPIEGVRRGRGLGAFALIGLTPSVLSMTTVVVFDAAMVFVASAFSPACGGPGRRVTTVGGG